jgi:ornithine cyclodeaminase/alanine dehydrogenase-like protein (mu-crystallin family)
MPLLLSEADVKELLSMPDLIAAMRDALTAFSSGQVKQPVRTIFDVGTHGGFFGLMPAYVSTPSALGAKLVTVYHSNLERGLPSHLGIIVLLDPETGALAAILDGRYITEARTAAVSAVSVKKLARPDSRVLAILGSGVQAHSHYEAFAHVQRFDEVRAWSPTRENLLKFTGATGARAMDSAEGAVRGADVIVLVTASIEPVIRDEWVKDGAHVISVGACRPTQREMDPALVLRSRLFVDSRAAAVKESGDVIGAGESHIVAELGEDSASRATAQEVTIFKSLGLAVEDVIAANLAFTRAKERGKGVSVSL